jgi:hypothetical protein
MDYAPQGHFQIGKFCRICWTTSACSIVLLMTQSLETSGKFNHKKIICFHSVKNMCNLFISCTIFNSKIEAFERTNFGVTQETKPRTYTSRLSRSRRSQDKKASSEVLSVQLKDIRRIEFVFNSAPQPLVFVRRHCVIISFTPIRIIILADRLLLFADEDMIDSHMKALFVDQLKVCVSLIFTFSISFKILIA